MLPKLFTIPIIDYEVHSYGFMLMIGFFAAAYFAVKRAEKVRANPDVVLNCAILALLGSMAAEIVRQARQLISEAGPCDIDYVELVHTHTMQPVQLVQGPVLAVLAVRIGDCRLIDNLFIDGDRDG